jgi:CheY-like chemotaxis protein
VLDLNLPRRTGLEVLADLKAGQALLPIPVLILTTSAAPPDVKRSYSLHASAYVS